MQGFCPKSAANFGFLGIFFILKIRNLHTFSDKLIFYSTTKRNRRDDASRRKVIVGLDGVEKTNSGLSQRP